MDVEATSRAANPDAAKGFDRRTLLTGASRLALIAVAGGPLWELLGGEPQAVLEPSVDNTFWDDGTGWTAA